MTNLTQEKIEDILSSVIDVHTNKDLLSSDNVKNIAIDGEIVTVSYTHLTLPTILLV